MPRTPDPEVGGSSPTRVKLGSNRVVSLSKAHLLPESTGNTQEVVAPSQHDRKIVYRDVKNQINNKTTVKVYNVPELKQSEPKSSQNTKRTYGQPSEQLFPKRWPLSNLKRTRNNINTRKVKHHQDSDTKTGNREPYCNIN